MSDLWVNATLDLDADYMAHRMATAKVQAAPLWPFLALARNPQEFEHRLALAWDHLAPAIDPTMLDPLVASLREDYRILTQSPPEAPTRPAQIHTATRHRADQLWDEFERGETPKARGQRMADSLWEGMARARGFEDFEHARLHDQNRQMEHLQSLYPQGSGRFAFDQDGDPHYQIQHPRGWTARDYGGPQINISHAATPGEDHDAIDVSDSQGRRPPGFGEPHLHHVLHDWASEWGPTYEEHLRQADPRIGQWYRKHGSNHNSGDNYQIWHSASRRWINVSGAAQESPGNDLYLQPIPEEGPVTGETGTYPQQVTGPDPWNPMNGKLPLPPNSVVQPANRFPAEPQPWTSSPDGQWRENPMSFAPYRASAHTSAGQRYQNEGVETGTQGNPYYFDQGNEGVQSQAPGYPPDVSLAEPDTGVEFYQQAQPYVAQRHQANQYIHQQGDGDWVITQKGTGKVLSHHDSEEKAEEAFRAMEWSKHSQHHRAQFFDPTLRHTADSNPASMMNPSADLAANADQGAQDSSDPMSTDAPTPPPPSMMPGGPGAEVTPPSPPTAGGPPQPPMPPRTSNWDVWAQQHLGDGSVRERPTMMNPSGVPDEYDSNTWEGPLNTAPRQTAEQRHINTPQRPRMPIPTNSSGDRMMPGNEEDEDEDRDQREAHLRRYVARAAQMAAERVMGAA